MDQSMTKPAKICGDSKPISADAFLAFIGNNQCFSDILLRTVDSELTDVSPIRFNDLNDFQDVVAANPLSLRLIIIDGRQCRENVWMCNNILEILERFKINVGIAVAYWETDIASLKTPIGFPAHEAGAAPRIQGYLPMNQSIDIWLSIIRLLACGGTYYPPEILSHPTQQATASNSLGNRQAQNANDGSYPVKVGPLTIRETEVMELVSVGFQNKQIASNLGLSEHTIKLHMHHIISKLSSKNRTEAAMRYAAIKP